MKLTFGLVISGLLLSVLEKIKHFSRSTVFNVLSLEVLLLFAEEKTEIVSAQPKEMVAFPGLLCVYCRSCLSEGDSL